MALDFKIDDRGDFIVSVPPLYQRLKLSWVNSNYPVLRLNFEQGQNYSTRRMSDKLKVNFITDQASKTMNGNFVVVTGKDELRQRIIIRLKTERGEMNLFKNLGSYLVTQRHEDIMSEETKTLVENIVLAEVADILENPKIIAVPKHTTGPFFCQNMNVYIYEDDELIYVLSL